MNRNPFTDPVVPAWRWMRLVCLALALWLGNSHGAVLPNDPTTKWTPFPHRAGVTIDYLMDQQTGTAEGDIISTNGLVGAFMAFNPGTNATSGSLGFRVRLGKDASPAGFKAVFHVGIDATGDGALDLFLSVDNTGASDAIRIFRTGTDFNMSPSTTSIDAQNPLNTYATTTANYHWTNVSATIDPAVTNAPVPNPTNIDGAPGAGETDYFLSFFVPFHDVVTNFQFVGVPGITTNSPLRFVIATATQPNSLNQDIGGLSGGINNPTNYNDLGILTPPITVTGNALPPVAVNDFAITIINTPVNVFVTTNDSSPDGMLLSITNVTATNGTASIVNGTNVLFTPANNFIGTGLVTYVLRDEIGGTSSATVTINVTSATADIVVGKSGPGSVFGGANIIYTIAVTNLGPATATNVVATDTLPAGVTFVGASSGGSLGSGTVTWPAMTLPAGATTNFTVTVTSAEGGVFTNRASATSPLSDPDVTNSDGSNTGAQVVTTVTPYNDVALILIAPANVTAGASYSYTLMVTNSGPSTATGIALSNVLPAGVTFVSASGSGAEANGVVSWPAFTLSPGTSTSFTINVTAPVSGSLFNTASVTADTADSNPLNNFATATTTVSEQADLAVTVTSPASVLAGETFNYSITVANNGPSDAASVVVSNALPSGVTFVSASSGGANNSDIVTWPSFTLASGATTNFSITVTASANGSLTNSASVSGAVADPNLANNSATSFTTVTPQADLAVTLSAPATVNAGASFEVTISVTNAGPSDATGVVLTNFVPAGATFVSATGGGNTNDGLVVWPAFTLVSGAATNFVVTFTAPASGSLTNIAGVTSAVADPSVTNNSAIIETTVISQADLSIVVTAPANVAATATFDYTITVVNNGPSSATGVSITNVLPVNATFVSASAGGVNNSGTVLWPAFTLTSGASTNFTVTVTAPTSGTLTNTATAGSPIADPNPANNSSTVFTSVSDVADLIVTIDAPATFFAGANLSYRVRVVNAGPSDATNVLVTNVLPAGATFVSATGGGVNNSGVVTWTVPAIRSGGFAHLFVTITVPTEGGTLLDSASAFAATADPDLANNTNSALTVIIPRADIAVRKTGPANVQASAQFTYTITVTNFGPSTATNISATDALPSGLAFVGASSGGSLNQGVVTWPQFDLAVGTFTNFTVTVTAPASGSFTNIASASSPVTDPDSSNNTGGAETSRVITTVTPVADVFVIITQPSQTFAGATTAGFIGVTNLGPSTASNVVVTSVLDPATTFSSATYGGTNASNVVTWPTITLLPGEGVEYLVYFIAPSNAASVTNRASSTATTFDPDLSNNDGSSTNHFAVSLVVPVADIALGKSAPFNVAGGSNFTYAISVTNLGPSIASNVVVTDHLPGTLAFVGASSGGTLVSGNVVWPAFNLAAGTVTNFTLTVTAPASGSATNSVSSTSDTADSDPGNNDGTNASNRTVTGFFTGRQFTILIAPTTFNPQSGLFEQRVTVTNTSLSTVPATRLYVSNLRSNVFLRNASGSNAGVPYVQYNSPLNPGSNVTFLLEFYVVDRRPFTNTLQNITAEAVLPTVVSNAGEGMNIRRVFIDSREANNPRVVVEFPTVVGRVYTILYSADLLTWKAATPSITASANVTQWYDDGPPKTESRPTNLRYYRVIAAP